MCDFCREITGRTECFNAPGSSKAMKCGLPTTAQPLSAFLASSFRTLSLKPAM